MKQIIRLYYTEITQLPAEENKKYAEAYGKEIGGSDKAIAQNLSSAVLLGKALKDALGITEYKVKRDEKGKPFLEGLPGVFISISHSGEYAFCAVSDKNCGADAEKIREFDERLRGVAKRYFPGKSIVNAEEFFREWTSMEAYGKYTGKGLAEARGRKSGGVYTESFITDGYAVSLCGEGEIEYSLLKC